MKAQEDRHTHFISVVFRDEEGRKAREEAGRDDMKVSAWIRKLTVREIERREKARKRAK